MTENDYIAEYVKERHPSILGVDYVIWKSVRLVADACRGIAEIFKGSDYEAAVEEDFEGEGTESEEQA